MHRREKQHWREYPSMMDPKSWHYASKVRGTEEFTLRILQEHFRQSLGSVFLIMDSIPDVDSGERFKGGDILMVKRENLKCDAFVTDKTD